MTERRTNIARNEERESDLRRARVGGSRDAGISPERLDQIRERLREGAYDSAAVREATARGILGKGDL